MSLKKFLEEISSVFRINKLHQEAYEKADDKEIPFDSINKVAKELHPGKINAIVKEIKKETNDSARITFSSPLIPLFKAGTYLTINLKINESIVTRAYSIVSSPLSSYRNKEVSIIVKDYPDGFVSTYLNHQLKEKDEVIIEVGLGQFYLDEYRDKKNILAIAGGAGITPFISIAHDIKERNLDYNLIILYGSDNPNEIIAKEELESLMQDNIKIIHVISGNYPYKGEKGFITKELIKKYAKEDCSYFFSGPRVMYLAILKEIGEIGGDIRKIRAESFPINDITKHPEFDKNFTDKEFDIEVHQGINVKHIKALAKESIAVALERSGLRINTSCRAGSCGVCRIKILKGDYFVPSDMDKRRYSDKECNYVHSCSTYPKSDLIIKINICNE